MNKIKYIAVAVLVVGALLGFLKRAPASAYQQRNYTADNCVNSDVGEGNKRTKAEVENEYKQYVASQDSSWTAGKMAIAALDVILNPTYNSHIGLDPENCRNIRDNITFEDLTEPIDARKIYHDANSNGKLDTGEETGYAIKEDCLNLIKYRLPAVIDRSEWYAYPKTRETSGQTVNAGSSFTFNHIVDVDVFAYKASDTNSLKWYVERQARDRAGAWARFDKDRISGNLSWSTNRNQSTEWKQSKYDAPADAKNGRQVCERIVADPGEFSGGRTRAADRSSWECVDVVNPPWNLTLKSEIQRNEMEYRMGTIELRPQDTVRFQHSLRTDNDMLWTSSNWTVAQSLNGVLTTLNPDANPGNGTFSSKYSDVDMMKVSDSVSPRTILNKDVGSTVCQSIVADPGSRSDTGAPGSVRASDPAACFHVPYNYENDPIAKRIGEAAAEQGSEVSAEGILEVESRCRALIGADPNVCDSKDTKVPYTYSTNTREQEWRLTHFVIPRGNPNKDGILGIDRLDLPDEPCTANVYQRSGIVVCQTVDSGSGSYDKGSVQKVGRATIPVLNGAAIGDKYCFAMAVKGANSETSGVWRHSEPACFDIAKRAGLQIQGADSWSGMTNKEPDDPFGDEPSNGGFYASDARGKTTDPTKCKQSGSWSTGGLLTTGKIGYFGSAGFIDRDEDCDIDDQSKIGHEKLKFANSRKSPNGTHGYDNDKYGGFMAKHHMTDLYSYYRMKGGLDHDTYGGAGNGEAEISSLDIGTITKSGSYEINNGRNRPFPVELKGQIAEGVNNLVLIVNGDVKITGDITFRDDYQRADQIPTLAIIAMKNSTVQVDGDIIVEPNVHRMDGIYATGSSGTFYSCGRSADRNRRDEKLSYQGVCSQDQEDGLEPAYQGNVGLVVNGAIIANKTSFQRTNGTENAMDSTPAELIRYNPALYIAPYERHRKVTSNMKTVVKREVAPRW